MYLKVGIILFILLSFKVNFVLKTQVFLQLWKFFLNQYFLKYCFFQLHPLFFSHGTFIMSIYFSIFLQDNCSFVVGISIYVLYSGWIIQDCFLIHKFSIQMCLDFILCYLWRIYPILSLIPVTIFFILSFLFGSFYIYLLLFFLSLFCLIISCSLYENVFFNLLS